MEKRGKNDTHKKQCLIEQCSIIHYLDCSLLSFISPSPPLPFPHLCLVQHRGGTLPDLSQPRQVLTTGQSVTQHMLHESAMLLMFQVTSASAAAGDSDSDREKRSQV